METVTEGKVAHRLRDRLLVGLLLGLAVLVLPFAIVYAVVVFLYELLLCTAIWISWGRRRVLFVYSESPVWKVYVEAEILPRVRDRAVVLNWSERRSWNQWSLAALAFHRFSGSQAFNPIAVIFRPFRFVRVLRYWKAFKDFKHGNTQPVEKLNAELFEALAD
jgi:hypothetical protein